MNVFCRKQKNKHKKYSEQSHDHFSNVNRGKANKRSSKHKTKHCAHKKPEQNTRTKFYDGPISLPHRFARILHDLDITLHISNNLLKP